MARARELREAFGFNTECDLPPNATELSESDDLLRPNDMGGDDNAGEDGLLFISEDEDDTWVEGPDFTLLTN